MKHCISLKRALCLAFAFVLLCYGISAILPVNFVLAENGTLADSGSLPDSGSVHTHSWNITSHSKPTCAKQGRISYVCKGCGASFTEILPAIGHAFSAYVPKSNDTHVAVCKNGCGETLTGDCTYGQAAVNGVTIQICTVCGSLKVIPESQLSSSEEVPTASAVPEVEIAVKPVENVKLTASSGAAVSDKLAAVVASVKPAVPAESAIDSENTFMVFAVAFSQDGESAVPAETLKISIPLSDSMASLLAGEQNVKLFQLLEGNETAEIPYEIANGELVFEINQAGLFFFQAAD